MKANKIAPEKVLKAALDTIKYASISCRSWSYDESTSLKQVGDLMDAIHEVPSLLTDWDSEKLSEIRNHFGCFDHKKHGVSVNLEEYFNQKLEG